MARNNSRGSGNQELSDVNTTPLIDVMLVLLVMMIVTLPSQTHLINMNLPSNPSNAVPPPTIDIDPDGTIVWNSEPLGGIAALEAHFRQEASRVPQAQIQLRPSALAKYDVVASVMAAAQRNDMARVGFNNIGQYAD